MNNPKLTIIVLSYNTKKLLRDCLQSLVKVKDEVNFEILVPDNGSTDGSFEMVEAEFPQIKVIRNDINLGFAAGNNVARPLTRGRYVLFLNSDTIVYKDTLKKTVKYLDENESVGALTCKLVLPDGTLDKDARRSFITPWIGFIHIFLKIDRLFPKSKLFGKYWYGYLSPDTIHEVDVLQGAFFLTRKKILDDVGWFDEDYFLDGEDIDLSWRIKHKGWKLVYYPEVKILHLKGASKGKNNHTKNTISLKEKLKYRMAGTNSMELFIRKRLWKKYPLAFNYFMLAGIKVLKYFRIIKLVLFG